MTNEEYLKLRKGIKAEEGRTPPDDVAVSQVIRKLSEWGSEPHNALCNEIRGRCRHERAKESLVEINNAVAACQKEDEETERALQEKLMKGEL